MSLLPSSHFSYLSPPALYLSILPTHNLFHYVPPIPSRSNSPSPSLPFYSPCLSFIFCQFPLSFHPLSWCQDTRFLACDVKVRFFSYSHDRRTPHRCDNPGSDPALSVAARLQSGTPCRCTGRSGLGLRFTRGYAGSSCRFGRAARVRLFVCLPSFVLCCHASRSTPVVSFWAPPAMTVLTPANQDHTCTDAHTHSSSTCVYSGFATFHRIFYELIQACMFVNRERMRPPPGLNVTLEENKAFSAAFCHLFPHLRKSLAVCGEIETHQN